MTIEGTFKNGVVVPDTNVQISDGTRVQMLIAEKKSLGEVLARFPGSLQGPKDWARNHDHYLYQIASPLW